MTHKDGYTLCNFCGSHESRGDVSGRRTTGHPYLRLLRVGLRHADL